MSTHEITAADCTWAEVHFADIGEARSHLDELISTRQSLQSLRNARATVAAGLPAVLAVPSTEKGTSWHTPVGNVVLVCPAQRRDTSCSDCMLCHQAGRGRRVIVAFVAHGTGKRKADAVIQSKEPLA